MSTLLDYYEYSKLAAAAYVDLTNLGGAQVAATANAAEKLPLALANQTFDNYSDEAIQSGQPVWTIPNFGANETGYYGNDAEGFAATCFQRTNSDGTIEKVLAIRGTEPTGNQLSLDLLKADIGQIGFFGLALGQAVSMVNLMRRLQTEWRKAA